MFNVAVIVGSLGAPCVLHRLGARRTLMAGFVVIGSGIAVLTTLSGAGAPVGRRLVSFTLMGAALGAASVASTQTGTEAADGPREGVVAGALISAAQVGTALGLALTPLATTPAGLASAYRVGFLSTLVVAVAGVLVSLLISATRAPAIPEGAPPSRPSPRRPACGSPPRSRGRWLPPGR